MTVEPRPAAGETGPDAVVVGGGAIGLAVAWRAAQWGLDVVVVDDAPGAGASAVAAGMLAPVTEVHYGEEPLLALALESARRWPDFAAEVEDTAGRPVGYRPCGTLAVALDADDNRALAELHRFQRELGLDVERLGGRECRQLEPMLSPSVRGGVHVAGDHQVDPLGLLAALLVCVERSGVKLVHDRAVALDTGAAGRVSGVRLASGESLGAGTVVLAAGCWSADLAGLPPGATLPVRPVKGQILRLRGPSDPPLLRRNVRGVVRGSSVYVVPRADGRLVVGATMEEMGFDTRLTAGAAHDLLRDGIALVPGLAEVELVEVVAGLRPGTPDNAPLLGRTALDGLVAATGHYRNGILLTPVTADAIAELLETGEEPDSIRPFSPTRLVR